MPADYLLRLASSNVGRAYKTLALEALDLGPSMRIADLGCGPGADLGALLDRVGPAGHVLGIDHDPDAVAVASKRFRDTQAVEVRAGDVHALGVAAESFDRVRTDRVLQHVRDPTAVLREIARVHRPGGRAVFAEPDWGTLALDHPDDELADAFRRFVVDRAIRNPMVGRQLRRLAVPAGLVTLSVHPFTAVFTDVREADRVLGFERVTRRAVDAGYITKLGSRLWLDHLTTGPFLASLTLFITVAERPSGQVAEPG